MQDYDNEIFEDSPHSINYRENAYSLPDVFDEIKSDKYTGNCEEHQRVQSTIEKEKASINLVPDSLRSLAVKISVTGSQTGEYYLVPYKGKIKNYTDMKVQTMFIPQTYNGNPKLVPVAVAINEKVIFISLGIFKKYETLAFSPLIEIHTTP